MDWIYDGEIVKDFTEYGWTLIQASASDNLRTNLQEMIYNSDASIEDCKSYVGEILYKAELEYKTMLDEAYNRYKDMIIDMFEKIK